MPTLQEQLDQTAVSRDKHLLQAFSRQKQSVIDPRKPIPEEDLVVLEKLYHKEYPNCGRKHGALLRYIKFFREEYETPNHLSNLIKHIKRAANDTRT